MSWISKSVACRFVALLLAMQLLGAAFCLPSLSVAAAGDAVAIGTADHGGEPCHSTQNDCEKALCHPALAASAGAAVVIAPGSHRHLNFSPSFSQFASGPGSPPPLTVSA